MQEPLNKEVEELQNVVAQQAAMIKDLSAQIRLYRAKLFGRSSEKWPVLPEKTGSQLSLFEDHAPASPKEIAEETKAPVRKRRRGTRQPLPADLPRQDEIVDLLDHEKLCACCGKPLHQIGEDTTEKLEYKPAEIFVKRIVRPRYACRSCKNSVAQAPLPDQLIPRANAGVSLITHLIVSKYADHLPLYRMEQIFLRAGIDIDRARMCDWLMKVATLLAPFVALMLERVMESDVLCADETRLQVQSKNGKKKSTKQCWLWAYYGGDEAPFTVFNFQDDRSSTGPKEILKDFSGVLMTDDYSVYTSLKNKREPGEHEWTPACCMAHARRKFVEAHKAGAAESAEAIIIFGELYTIEKKLKELPAEKRTTYRRENATPILKKLKEWISERLHVLPGQPLGKAIGYTLNNWEKLNVYLNNARIPIDNNAIERAIRPVAIGRKNWLFAGSERGGQAAAIFFTIIASAKRNGHNPHDYLADLLRRIPTQPINRLDELLPNRRKPPGE